MIMNQITSSRIIRCLGAGLLRRRKAIVDWILGTRFLFHDNWSWSWIAMGLIFRARLRFLLDDNGSGRDRRCHGIVRVAHKLTCD